MAVPTLFDGAEPATAVEPSGEAGEPAGAAASVGELTVMPLVVIAGPLAEPLAAEPLVEPAVGETVVTVAGDTLTEAGVDTDRSGAVTGAGGGGATDVVATVAVLLLGAGVVIVVVVVGVVVV